MRLHYVKYPHRLMQKPPNLVMLAIIISGHMFSIGVAHFRLSILNDVEAASLECFEPSLYQYGSLKTFTRAAFVSMLGMVVIGEVMIYTSICWLVHQQDKSIAPFISVESVQRRRQKNATTLVGHITHFLIEFGFLVALFTALLMDLSHMDDPLLLPFLLKIFENAFTSIVMTARSRPLLEELTSLKQYLNLE